MPMKTSDMLRVSPLSIIYFCISNIYKAFNLWPVFAGIVAIPATRAWLFDVGVAGVGVLILAISIINYWFFTFYFDHEKIQINSGLIFKKKLTLYFERVQEANLEQAVYFRPFELWALKLESAGSSKEEIILPGIKHLLASELKQKVLDAQKNPAQKVIASQTESTSIDNVESINEPAPLRYQIKLDVIDLFRYGLMHNTLIYYVAILAPVLSQNENFWRNISNWIGDSWAAQELMSYLNTHNLWVGMLVVCLLIALLFLAVYALSILLALVKYWDYNLTVEGDRFQYQAGLLNKLASGFRQHKLQTLVVKQSLIARLLKRYSIEVKQTNEAKIKQGEINMGFVIPVVTKQQLDDILDLLNIKRPEFQPCLPAKIFWDSILWGGVLVSLIAVGLFAAEISLWFLVPIFLAIVLLNIKNWYSIGYSMGEEGFVVRRGLLGIKTIYVPTIKIQKIQLSQGPLQRIHQSASIALWSGATLEHISFIPLKKLQTESDQLIQKISRFRGKWM